jgi:hypothetical protein
VTAPDPFDRSRGSRISFDSPISSAEMIRWNDAEDGAHPLAVHEELHRKAGDTVDLVGEIGVAPAGELLTIALRGNGHQDALRLGRAEHDASRHRRHVAVMPHHRNGAGAEVKIRGLHFEELQKETSPSRMSTPPRKARGSGVAAGASTGVKKNDASDGTPSIQFRPPHGSHPARRV